MFYFVSTINIKHFITLHCSGGFRGGRNRRAPPPLKFCIMAECLKKRKAQIAWESTNKYLLDFCNFCLILIKKIWKKKKTPESFQGPWIPAVRDFALVSACAHIFCAPPPPPMKSWVRPCIAIYGRNVPVNLNMLNRYWYLFSVWWSTNEGYSILWFPGRKRSKNCAHLNAAKEYVEGTHNF